MTTKKRIQDKDRKKSTRPILNLEKMIELFADPNSGIETIADACDEIGVNTRYFHHAFSADDLHQARDEALRRRRERYQPKLSKVDDAVLRMAMTGDTAAAKLAYQRFEGWTPSEKRVVEGGDKPIKHEHGLSEEVKDKLSEIYKKD